MKTCGWRFALNISGDGMNQLTGLMITASASRPAPVVTLVATLAFPGDDLPARTALPSSSVLAGPRPDALQTNRFTQRYCGHFGLAFE